jgi:hypothetical protein
VPTSVFAVPGVLALFMLQLAAPARAQEPTESDLGLAPGARIRVTTASPSASGGSPAPLVGQWAGSEGSDLRLVLGPAETRAVPKDQILRIERSVSPSRRSRGALIGFGVGLLAAFGKAAVQGGCNDGCNEENLAAALLVASAAATLGAVASPGERWADVNVGGDPGRATPSAQAGPRVRLVPQLGRRVGLTLVASF